MPQQHTRDTLARQWELLKTLPNRGPGLTARALAERLADAGFPVSKRTVERDLNELAGVFPLVCNDKGVPRGWYWQPGRDADLPGITLADALSLHLVEESLRPLLPVSLLNALEPRFQQAREKLQALAESNATAGWSEKVRQVAPTLPLLPPVIPEGVLATVQNALLADEQLEVSYHRIGVTDTVLFRLHPLALLQRGPVTYLAATAFDYTDVRLYALHRMQDARVTGEPAHRPKEFDIDAYLASGALHFRGDEEGIIVLEARVAGYMADMLRETPLSADMCLAPEGEGWQLRATVVDSWTLRWWLLSQGPGITVLAPTPLRQALIDDLEQALAGYQPSKSPSKDGNDT